MHIYKHTQWTNRPTANSRLRFTLDFTFGRCLFGVWGVVLVVCVCVSVSGVLFSVGVCVCVCVCVTCCSFCTRNLILPLSRPIWWHPCAHFACQCRLSYVRTSHVIACTQYNDTPTSNSRLRFNS